MSVEDSKLTKILKHLEEAKQKGAKTKDPENKHVHVVYSKGTWGNREWNYRVYSMNKNKDVESCLRQEPHHTNLAKDGWHVEHSVVADRKDMEKTQNSLNTQMIKHAGKDAEIRKKLTAIEKPKEPRKK
jgi:hypothetical protein